MSEFIRLTEFLAKRTFENEIIYYWFNCPGCKCWHPYTVGPKMPDEPGGQARWEFNGDITKPSFTPSLLCNPSAPEHRCHLYVTDGKIHYCGDCYHDLRGQVVDMIPLGRKGYGED